MLRPLRPGSNVQHPVGVAMSDNPFAAVLSPHLDSSHHPPESLGILQEFCLGVELSTHGRVRCTLERGYVVNDGQEWHSVLQPSYGGPKQVLLRAYVPLCGWPVRLNLYDGPLVECDRRTDLMHQLQQFLQQPAVIEQIRYVMSSPPDSVASP